MLMQNKRLTWILVTVSLLLLAPLVAMQFTPEVNWTGSDFAVAGILLFGTALLCELVLRKVRITTYRWILLATILAALVLIWAELAVGIFGTPFAGN